MQDRITLLEDAVKELLKAATIEQQNKSEITPQDLMLWARGRKLAEEALVYQVPFAADWDTGFVKIKAAMYLEGLDKISVQFENFDIMTVDSVWLWMNRNSTPDWANLFVKDGCLKVPTILYSKKVYNLHTVLREISNIRNQYGHIEVSYQDHAGLGNCEEGTFDWLRNVGIDVAGRESVTIAEIIDGYKVEPRREALLVIRHFVKKYQPEDDKEPTKGPVQSISGESVRWATSLPLWAK